MAISKRAKLTKRDIKPKEIDYNLLADEVKDDIQNALDNTNVDLTNLSTDIIPSLSETFSLGTPDKKFHKAYIQELHIDENTLYIGDTPILGTEQDNILIQADQDQSILIKTKGLGSSGMSSQSNIHLETTGLNSEIRINSSGAGSKVSLGSNSSINLSAPEIKLDGDINVLGNLAVDSLSVRGNIAVEGEEFIVDTQTVQVENNIIEINKGEVGNGVTSGIAGIRIDRGDAPDYMLVFDEQNDMFMIGMDGNLETIATREYVDSKNLEVPGVAGSIAWDNISNKPDTFAPATHTHSNISITAGNGLSGGGELTDNITITLGTPGTLTNSTSNEVTSTSHTHSVTGFEPSLAANRKRQIFVQSGTPSEAETGDLWIVT